MIFFSLIVEFFFYSLFKHSSLFSFIILFYNNLIVYYTSCVPICSLIFFLFRIRIICHPYWIFSNSLLSSFFSISFPNFSVLFHLFLLYFIFSFIILLTLHSTHISFSTISFFVGSENRTRILLVTRHLFCTLH